VTDHVGQVTARSTNVDPRSNADHGDEPVIVAATMTAGHDGAAEAVIDIRYPNGAVRSVTFDCDSLGLALDRYQIASLDDLCGRPWTVLVETPPIHQNQR
jgi:hypothetical protein